MGSVLSCYSNLQEEGYFTNCTITGNSIGAFEEWDMLTRRCTVFLENCQMDDMVMKEPEDFIIVLPDRESDNRAASMIAGGPSASVFAILSMVISLTSISILLGYIHKSKRKTNQA